MMAKTVRGELVEPHERLFSGPLGIFFIPASSSSAQASPALS
jgi:hypothetical protein